MKKIYFAGPDVFRPDYKELCKSIRLLCWSENLNPLFPGDCDLSDPKEIFEENKTMIAKSDFVIANLNSFRGSEPDSGTVWEVACAYTLGIPVIAYIRNSYTVKEKAKFYFLDTGKLTSFDEDVMPDGMTVENFNFPVNLMLQQSITKIVEGGYEQAIAYVRDNYDHPIIPVL